MSNLALSLIHSAINLFHTLMKMYEYPKFPLSYQNFPCTSYFLATSLPFGICSLMEIRKRQGREIKWGSQQSRGYLAKQKVWGEKGVQQNCSHHIQRLNAHHASMTKTIPIGHPTPLPAGAYLVACPTKILPNQKEWLNVTKSGGISNGFGKTPSVFP